MSRTAIIALLLLAGCAFGGTAAWKVQGWRYTNILEKQNAAAERERARVSEEARTTEAALQRDADKGRRANEVAIVALNTRLRAALEQLRQRPARPAPGTGTATVAPAAPAFCTGEQLYRDDAELVIREAARADTIRLGLVECYAAYERARTLTVQPTD